MSERGPKVKLQFKPPRYGIGYAPPVAIKDEPHRALDTLADWSGVSEIRADDYGVISVVSEPLNIGTIDLQPIEATEEF